MTEEKKSHWQFLANLLGAKPQETTDDAAAEPSQDEPADKVGKPVAPLKPKKSRILSQVGTQTTKTPLGRCREDTGIRSRRGA